MGFFRESAAFQLRYESNALIIFNILKNRKDFSSSLPINLI